MNLNRIKAAMVENGDTQKELAVKLGISNTGLCRRFSGKQKFRIDEVEKISELYKKNPAEFF